MKTKWSIGVLVSAALVAGCSTPLPNVQYREYPCKAQVGSGACMPGPDSLVRFTLPKTLLTITSATGKQQAAATDLVSATTRTESTARMFEMLKDDPWGQTTSITFTKVEGTDTLNQLNSQVSDDRANTIGKWGGVVSTLLSAVVTVAAAAIDLHEKFIGLPVVIDTEPLLKGAGPGASPEAVRGYVEDSSVSGVRADFKFSYGPVPHDAIPTDQYILSAKDQRKHEIFTSVCRTATIRFLKKAKRPLKGTTFSFIVADPNYVQVVRFTPKSAVKARPICGMDITPESAGSSTPTADVAEAIANQAKALVEVWKTYKAAREKAKQQ